MPNIYYIQGSQQDRYSKIVALVASEVQNSSLYDQNSSLFVSSMIRNTLKTKIKLFQMNNKHMLLFLNYDDVSSKLIDS